MNPVVIVHFVVALLAIAAAVPLMRGVVKMNPWYGVRIPAAFESEERWFDLNRYGGRLLFLWGLCIVATALVGSQLRKSAWVAYDWSALVIVIGGLALVIALIFRHAGKKKSCANPSDL
jgi:uncharacterized membrane protein